ncbi:hypothetical protein BZA05DRAFT_440464 [Tricharina praecox]|uniref:uncharacterized protein n=1 Tax=Tricharina praecox TaxID=43433 RepID=UPI00221E863E|nr:uncharacterized protein BZA05DRAFT_440464 [Tricharina praecox]KAI5858848.1 hypothetical protein BZA05DRAFT_440464 [Tricharina praecox]
MHTIFGSLLAILLLLANLVNGRVIMEKKSVNKVNDYYAQHTEINVHPKVMRDIASIHPLNSTAALISRVPFPEATDGSTETSTEVTASVEFFNKAQTADRKISIKATFIVPSSGHTKQLEKVPKQDNKQNQDLGHDLDHDYGHNTEAHHSHDHDAESHHSHAQEFHADDATREPPKLIDNPTKFSAYFWFHFSKARFPIANLTRVCGNYTWEHLTGEQHRLHHNHTEGVVVSSPNIPDNSLIETKETDKEINIAGCHCLHRKNYFIPCACEQAMADRAKISARLFFAMAIVVASLVIGFILHYSWHIFTQCVRDPGNVDWTLPDRRPSTLAKLAREKKAREEQLRIRGPPCPLPNVFVGIGGDLPRFKAKKAKLAAREKTWWMKSYRATQGYVGAAQGYVKRFSGGTQ